MRKAMLRRCALVFGGLFGALAGSLLGGCIVAKAVFAPVKLAATTVVVAGETAGTVVTTTGKVAVSAVKATGSLGSTGIDSAAKLGQAGMVTFVDSATGAVTRVPWQEGMTLAAGGDAAKLQVAQRALDVVRAGKLVYSASQTPAAQLPLQSGDVIRLVKK